MKIILCIFLLNITAVSVFGQSVELNGILGKSIEFPAAVKKGGYLMYGGDPIGESSLGTPGIGKYSGRVQWDICTGLFSLSGLKMEDIGEYKVQNTDQNINTVFQLNLYKDNVNVSKPHVSISQNEYPCTIECTAERGTEVTLSWYREGEKKSFASSRVASAPHLHLPHSVESGTYTCEAKNSVSRETSDPLTVGAHCTDFSTGIIVASSVVGVIAAVVVLIAVVFAVQYHRFKRRRRAVKTLSQVKKLLNNLDLHASGEKSLELSPDDGRILTQVKKLLNDLDLHASAQSLIDHENSEASGFIRRCLGFIRRCLGNRSKHPTKDGGCIYDPVRNTITTTTIHEKMTSSHQTEVPSNQDTEVVEP